MELIKKATRQERYGGKLKQDTMRKLSELYGQDIVYIPYGKQGNGFYTNGKGQKK